MLYLDYTLLKLFCLKNALFSCFLKVRFSNCILKEQSYATLLQINCIELSGPYFHAKVQQANYNFKHICWQVINSFLPINMFRKYSP